MNKVLKDRDFFGDLFIGFPDTNNNKGAMVVDVGFTVDMVTGDRVPALASGSIWVKR